MGFRFGYDFSRIRVHTDARAAESVRAVNALAYTVGQDVVFGRGQYAPGTIAGKRLLAHELAHTIQQSDRVRQTAGKLEITRPVDAVEQQADDATKAVLEARPFDLTPDATGKLTRQVPQSVPTTVYKTRFDELNGLSMAAMLDELNALGREELNDLRNNSHEAAHLGTGQQRLEIAMDIVWYKKFEPAVLPEIRAYLLARMQQAIPSPEFADQQAEITRFLDRRPAVRGGETTPAVETPAASSQGAAEFEPFTYKMSTEEVAIIKQRERQVVKRGGKEQVTPGRVEIKESPAYFTAEVLKLAGVKNPQAWFSSFTNISFLGVRVSNIHTDLAAHLKAVEQKFAEQYGGDQNDPVVAGKALGLKQGIGGGRPAPTGTAISMHLFGLAIDVNYDTNPWIAEETTLKAENEIIRRATLLVNGVETSFTPNTMSYDQIAALNEAMKTYFSYIDRRDLLETQLKDAKGIWAGMSTDDALKRIQADFNDLAVKWERTGAKQEAIKQGGFLDLGKELVEGMGLDWGGKYGDMMHFDMRNKGIGAKVDWARKEYVRQKTKTSEQRYADEHSQ